MNENRIEETRNNGPRKKLLSLLCFLIAFTEIMTAIFIATRHWESALILLMSGVLYILISIGIGNFKMWSWFLVIFMPVITLLCLLRLEKVNPAVWHWLILAVTILPAGLALSVRSYFIPDDAL